MSFQVSILCALLTSHHYLHLLFFCCVLVRGQCSPSLPSRPPGTVDIWASLALVSGTATAGCKREAQLVSAETALWGANIWLGSREEKTSSLPDRRWTWPVVCVVIDKIVVCCWQTLNAVNQMKSSSLNWHGMESHFLAFGVILSLLALALLPTKSHFPLCCNHPSHVLSNIQSYKPSFVFHGSD